MHDRTDAFFDKLGETRFDVRLASAHGVLRIELPAGDHHRSWLVTMDGGAVAVAHGPGEADCVLRTDRETFSRLTDGSLNLIVALLQGVIAVRGALEVLLDFQRLLPARAGIGYATRS